MFQKSINSVTTKKLIDFISIRVKPHETHKNKSKLLVYGSFNIGSKTKGK